MPKKAIDLEPLFVHDLPGAPCFTGREKQLAALREFWQSDEQLVSSLVGVGGAGKTAISAQFLQWLLNEGEPKPGGVFVWSFYVDQNCSAFLHEAFRYFSGGQEIGDSGVSLVYRLSEVLSDDRRHLIVLDGIERIQREHGDPRGVFGQLEDGLMRQAVSRFAVGLGKTHTLITSRFPISDLRAWKGKSYTAINLENLSHDEAKFLLKRRGVEGDEREIDRMLEEFGTHALTIDHLGTYLMNFHDGKPAWQSLPKERVSESAEDGSQQERKLARVLKAYESVLSDEQRSLLSMFCIFRFGATIQTIHQLAVTMEGASSMNVPWSNIGMQEIEYLTRQLVDLNLLQWGQDNRLTAHPAVRDYFYSLTTDVSSMHRAVSGLYQDQLGFREEMVLGEIQQAWDGVVHECWVRLEEEYHALQGEMEARGEDSDDAPMPEFRLFPEQRNDLIDRIETSISRLTGRNSPFRHYFEDLVARLRRGEDFDWEIELERQPVLSSRPGEARPTTPAALDMLEELIHHTLAAGDRQTAITLYEHRLGGRAHLAKQLGDFERGRRIMEAFEKCPNRIDLSWYLRGVGELERARELLDRVRFLWTGTIYCLQGRLPEARRDPYWHSTQNVAALLMGDPPDHSAEFGWGEALVDADTHLFLGKLSAARIRATQGLERFQESYYQSMPEAVRCMLVLAEVERRQQRWRDAMRHVQNAQHWILRSGSVEHLCLLNITRGRLLLDRNEHDEARRCADEGIQLARRCGFGIYHIDMMLLRAAIELAKKDKSSVDTELVRSCLDGAMRGIVRATDQPATSADVPLDDLLIIGAEHEQCQYFWGKIEAMRLESELLAVTGDKKAASRITKEREAMVAKMEKRMKKKRRR